MFPSVVGIRYALAGLCAVLLIAAVGASEAAARYLDPFTFNHPSFCATEKPLRDFGLSRLPPITEIPHEEELPFGPPSVSVYGAFNSIFTGPATVGYGFSEENYRGTVRLNWTVTAQMWALTRGGRPVREVGHQRLLIGRLDAAYQPHIGIESPGKRGFYRFDIQFTDRKGGQLGAFSSYFRIVRPFFRVRLGLNNDTYRPGQLVLSRVENLGSETVGYGEAFDVQRRQRGRWMAAPDLGPEAWLLWAGRGGPGNAGRCSAWRLPGNIEPGRYRIVKRVERFGRGRSIRPLSIARPFRVVG